ncbi:hypothetical protein J7E88_18745 [Streptomyces sp. ISL-10]|uniref:hypothetical protein n=1 Tax=Streptomyces sp. ISL-10 TaxID=2819172 RepID=UPI001BE92AC3|nr:hypothetical protein [Streptomyces sp. ISL-10]MBT2367287.1 hypothetical protein [Streptomyces sp. ISL-10]
MSQLRRVGLGKQQLSTSVACAVFQNLAADLAHICVDYRQYAESYYFHDGDENTSLAANIMYLTAVAEQLPDGTGEERRLVRELLRVSLHDLAVTLDERFLHTGGTTQQVFARYAQDHGRAAKR